MKIPKDFQRGMLLSTMSTFSIGGPALYSVEVLNISDMQKVIKYCREHVLEYFVVGKGSNCLFDDNGFYGVIVHNMIDTCTYSGNRVVVGAGHSFARLGVETARRGMGGLEFAAGIPGTVGGAIVMNAGAHGCSVSDMLSYVTYVTEEGELVTYHNKDLTFGYRSSSFQGMHGAVVEVAFDLITDPEACKKQQEMLRMRKNTQPCAERSSGCVFRNPPGKYAGELIEQRGLKGAKIGGACVSDIHANFIVNDGTATASDVVALIAFIKEKVKTNTGVLLEDEIRYISNI